MSAIKLGGMKLNKNSASNEASEFFAPSPIQNTRLINIDSEFPLHK